MAGGTHETRGRQGGGGGTSAPAARAVRVSSGPSARVSLLAQPKRRVDVVSDIGGEGRVGGAAAAASAAAAGDNNRVKHPLRKFAAFGRALPKGDTSPSPPHRGARRRSESPLVSSTGGDGGGYAALAARRSASAKGLADSGEKRARADDVLRWRLESSESGSPAERFANSLRMSSSSASASARGRRLSPRDESADSPTSLLDPEPSSRTETHSHPRRALPLISVRSPPEALASPLQDVLERVARALQGTPGILAGSKPEFSPRGGHGGDNGIPREGQEALIALLELAKAHAART